MKTAGASAPDPGLGSKENREDEIRDAYRAEILGGLTDAGEEVLHLFLEAGSGVRRPSASR